MVKYKHLIQTIEDYLTKHPINEKARNIGKTGKWTTQTNEKGETTHTLTYKDGTTLTFKEETINIYGKEEQVPYISHLTYGNFDEDYQLHKGEKFFDYEKMFKDLKKEDLDFFNEYTSFKMSTLGMYLNQYVRGEWDRDDLYNMIYYQLNESPVKDMFDKEYLKGMKSLGLTQYLIENNDKYQNIIENTSLNGYGDFFTVREVNGFHDNDNLNKRIVKDKGYTSETVGCIMAENRGSISLEDEPWTIVTLYEDGNPANRGAYLGYSERRNEGTNYWEEILRPPNAKSERLIIDENNKIIIQRTYSQ